MCARVRILLLRSRRDADVRSPQDVHDHGHPNQPCMDFVIPVLLNPELSIDTSSVSVDGVGLLRWSRRDIAELQL